MIRLVSGTIIAVLLGCPAYAQNEVSPVSHARVILPAEPRSRRLHAERRRSYIGSPLALIVFGIVMMGLSALAVRIDRDYVRERKN